MGVGAAPGRLDILGGVADYSGSWVLQKPIAAMTTVAVEETSDRRWTVESPTYGVVTTDADVIVAVAHDARKVAEVLADIPQWSKYVLGSVALGVAELGWRPGGLRCTVRSDVPEAMSVSSSAALEVATLRAIAACAGRPIDAVRLAHLAQRAENVVVGAPCGLMDQLASSCGEPGALLPILCRPDHVGAPVTCPDDLVFVGLPSGQRHAVSGSPYRVARTAAFLAKALLDRAHGTRSHLTDFTTDEATALPERIVGSEADVEIEDVLSAVEVACAYPVRAAALFAIGEHARVQRSVTLLATVGSGRAIGRLLRESHDGYSSIGLGAPITDEIVAELDELHAHGVHGARTSGGGGGGTVVICADRSAMPLLETLATRRGVQLIC